MLVQLSAIVGVVQKRAIKDEKGRLRKWARDAVLGGAREAHRYLKKSERIPLRPFGHLPLLERAEARRKYWLNIWQERDEPGHLPEAQFQQIKNLAVAQAAQLKGISSRQISMTFTDMANTRPGLEGFHFRDIKGLPSEAFSALSWMYGQIESTGCWPKQMLRVLIACLPKSEIAERPIALLSVFCRVWCRTRGFLVQRWQQNKGVQATWDHAVAGYSVFDAASSRQFKAEFLGALDLQMATFLSDLRYFYDKISWSVLAEKALSLEFPPLVLHHVLLFYASPRVLVADEICSETLRPAKGILAGRPFATVMAKIYLWDLTRDVLLNQRPFQITTWVDDVGMDTANRSCRAAAVHMVSCYSAFVAGVVPSGLDMAVEKSGFVVSSKELRRELRLLLRKLLGPVPKVYDGLKDLGLDCTLARKRRLPTQKQRVAKAGKRLWKLRIFDRGVRQRLCRTNAFPAQIGDSSTQALPLASMCLHWERHQDPLFFLARQQLELRVKLVKRVNIGSWQLLGQVWQTSLETLRRTKHGWQVVKGPLAACQAMLLDHGWLPDEVDKWHDSAGLLALPRVLISLRLKGC